MLQRRLLLTGSVFIALLALPRDGTAGLVDVILEMSGPKMLGITGDIRILPNGCVDTGGLGIFQPAAAVGGSDEADRNDQNGGDDECERVSAKQRNRLVSGLRTFAAKDRNLSGKDESKQEKKFRYWYEFSAGYYFSIPKTINGHPYKYGDVQMITFEPMIEIESRSSKVDYSDMRLQVYHGIGGGLNYLFVEGTPPNMARGVIKFRPAGVVVPFGHKWGFDVAYDLRLYPKGFTASDFYEGAPPASDSNNWEFVHAFSGTVRWKF